MEYREYGEGHPVVFLHGNAAPETLYDLAERLSDEFRTLVPALPGFAGSPQVEGDGLGVVRDALLTWLDELDLDRLHLVGHSAGAHRGLDLALTRPDLVEKIALIGPAHHVDADLAADLRSAADGVEAGAVKAAHVAPAWVSPAYLEAHPEFVDELDAWFERDREALGVDVRRTAGARDLRDEMGALDHPAYVLVGELDTRTPVEMAQDLVRRLPNATLEVIEGVAHFVQTEQPEATADALRRFLR